MLEQRFICMVMDINLFGDEYNVHFRGKLFAKDARYIFEQTKENCEGIKIHIILNCPLYSSVIVVAVPGCL